MSKAIIDISVEYDKWYEIDCEDMINQATSIALEHAMGPQADQYEISVVMHSDEGIQKLNRDYRAKNKPTNVLSFPQFDGEMPVLPENSCLALGDIILAYETIEREAKEQDKNFMDHLAHLTVHGTLHLMGYDHENDSEAEIMESLEVKILSLMDIENPYAT